MTTSLERLWAGWRSTYIDSTVDPPADGPDCVFCAILSSGRPDSETYVLWRGDHCAALLNAYPYTSGHLMVLPRRHVGQLEDVVGDEGAELWATVRAGVVALKQAYRPEGINMGANLGRAAG